MGAYCNSTAGFRRGPTGAAKSAGVVGGTLTGFRGGGAAGETLTPNALWYLAFLLASSFSEIFFIGDGGGVLYENRVVKAVVVCVFVRVCVCVL